MADIAIRVEHISKRYVIDQQRSQPHRGWSSLTKAWPSMLARRISLGTRKEIHHALRDVSLEVNTGEVVGLIGSNGSGKSTLLKILSRITRPSAGRATIHGRVASLLEVGTGFHPELTGRENIYLGAAVHGMDKRAVARKRAASPEGAVSESGHSRMGASSPPRVK